MPPSAKSERKKIPIVLESLNSKMGVGKCLHPLLPEHKDSCDAVAAFLLFVHERQTIWKKKQEGRQDLTENKILSTKLFCNVYRELDKGSQYMRNCLLQRDLQETPSHMISHEVVERVLFKSIVYRLINKVDTFVEFGGLPSKEENKSFVKFLLNKRAKGEVSFTAAHQNMGYDRLQETLHFVKKNIKSLATQVVKGAEARSLKVAHKALVATPNIGAFFAWQILCDLLENRVLGANTDNQWVCLGPGGKSGLRKIFPLETTEEIKFIRLLRDICNPRGPMSGFTALALEFPAFLEKPLSVKNVEHSLCEFNKWWNSPPHIVQVLVGFSKAWLKTSSHILHLPPV